MGLVDIVVGKRKLTQEEFEAIVARQAHGDVNLEDLKKLIIDDR